MFEGPCHASFCANARSVTSESATAHSQSIAGGVQQTAGLCCCVNQIGMFGIAYPLDIVLSAQQPGDEATVSQHVCWFCYKLDDHMKDWPRALLIS